MKKMFLVVLAVLMFVGVQPASSVEWEKIYEEKIVPMAKIAVPFIVGYVVGHIHTRHIRNNIFMRGFEQGLHARNYNFRLPN